MEGNLSENGTFIVLCLLASWQRVVKCSTMSKFVPQLQVIGKPTVTSYSRLEKKWFQLHTQKRIERKWHCESALQVIRRTLLLFSFCLNNCFFSFSFSFFLILLISDSLTDKITLFFPSFFLDSVSKLIYYSSYLFYGPITSIYFFLFTFPTVHCHFPPLRSWTCISLLLWFFVFVLSA